MSGKAGNALRRRGARRRKARCPVCGRAAATRFAPFCSRYCAEVDLARWFDGAYVVPGREPAERAPEDNDGGA